MFSEVPTIMTEAQGSTQVCVQLLGTLERSVTVIADFDNFDTTSEDYSNTREVLVYESGGANAQCFQLLINSDDVLENIETFSIVLSSPDDAVVNIINGNAQVIIQDSSTLEVGFSSVPPSVEEGGTFLACVRINTERGRLSEQLILPITVLPIGQGEQMS